MIKSSPQHAGQTYPTHHPSNGPNGNGAAPSGPFMIQPAPFQQGSSHGFPLHSTAIPNQYLQHPQHQQQMIHANRLINNQGQVTSVVNKAQSNGREAKRELARRMRLKIQQEREDHDVLRSQPSTDPEKECIRRNIQQRIRMRMIRKGQIPPNPTLEELQMCGLQPISMAYPYQQYYPASPHLQMPMLYDGQGPQSSYAPSPYQQPVPMFASPYGFGPNSCQASPITMQAIPHSNHIPIHAKLPQQQQPQNQNLLQPKPLYSISPASCNRSSVDSNHSTMTMNSNSVSNSSKAVFDCCSYFDTTDTGKDESTPAPIEPFILPEREDYPPSTFESFFGEDFVLEKYQ